MADGWQCAVMSGADGDAVFVEMPRDAVVRHAGKLAGNAGEVALGEHGCLRFHRVPSALWRDAHKRVFFEPRPGTLRLFEKFNEPVKKLVGEWWERIETSQKFADSGKNVDRMKKSYEAFYEMFTTLNKNYINNSEIITILDRFYTDFDKMKEITQSKYNRFYAYHQIHLGHYYRTLFHIFKFIDRSNVEDKEFYAHLVRAQLSDQQVLLLFYNCFSDEGKGFKELVENYGLLKHIPDNSLPDDKGGKSSLLRTYYKDSAYGKKKTKSE